MFFRELLLKNQQKPNDKKLLTLHGTRERITNCWGRSGNEVFQVEIREINNLSHLKVERSPEACSRVEKDKKILFFRVILSHKLLGLYFPFPFFCLFSLSFCWFHQRNSLPKIFISLEHWNMHLVDVLKHIISLLTSNVIFSSSTYSCCWRAFA